MASDEKFPVAFLIGVLVSFVLGVAALIVITTAEKSHADLPMLGQIPNFEFIKQDGSPFGLRNMAGKINVVDFMFTSCREACPIMSSNMAKLYQQFDATGKVQFVSISVDPGRDSLSVLQAYANAFGVNDDHWVFLRQPVDDVVKLSEKGFMLTAQNLPENHSTKFALVDDKGQIRGYYDGQNDTDMKLLARDIMGLIRAMQR
jgi:protein SCO1/2